MVQKKLKTNVHEKGLLLNEKNFTAVQYILTQRSFESVEWENLQEKERARDMEKERDWDETERNCEGKVRRVIKKD